MTEIIQKKPPAHPVVLPQKSYQEPLQVIDDRRLSWDEKMAALKNWEMDVKAALTADDENMTAVKMPNATNPSEMLGKVQEAERILEETAPSPLDAQTQLECDMLTALVAMNIDACIFYRKAAVDAEHSEIEKNYHGLEKMHHLVVCDLSAAIKKKDRITAEAEVLYDAQYQIFKSLCAMPYPSAIGAGTSLVIATAEEACAEAVDRVYADTSLSEQSRAHLSCVVELLRERHAYLGALGYKTP